MKNEELKVNPTTKPHLVCYQVIAKDAGALLQNLLLPAMVVVVPLCPALMPPSLNAAVHPSRRLLLQGHHHGNALTLGMLWCT